MPRLLWQVPVAPSMLGHPSRQFRFTWPHLRNVKCRRGIASARRHCLNARRAGVEVPVGPMSWDFLVAPSGRGEEVAHGRGRDQIMCAAMPRPWASYTA